MKKLAVGFIFLFFSLPIFAQLNAGQTAIRKVFFDFLGFYKKNEAKFNSFKLYTGTGKENNPPYKLQWAEAEKYFAYLRSNVPYVGEAYIKAEKQHFKQAEKSFKEYPEEELPAGFDYDRWAGGQESIQYTYKWYTSAKNKYVVAITGNNAILKIGSELLNGSNNEKDRNWSFVPFVKEKGKWKMADNVYPADDGN